MKLAKIEVTYKDHMGSDLEVANAARVSFDKESDWAGSKITITEVYNDLTRTSTGYLDGFVLSDKDKKLIKYLAEHNHWSPFFHCFIKFRIKAPIFVARQLQKHTVGLAWNEVSRRYVDYEPEFYMPEVWRGRPTDKKQGSAGSVDLWNVVYRDNGNSIIGDYYLDEAVDQSINDSLEIYTKLVDNGVAPEQARMILPQNTMTEWIWSGSLYAFARVVNLRSSSDAQEETRQVSDQIKHYLQLHFPVSSEYLIKV